MEFFFPEDDLQRMTPEETRVVSLSAAPYEDGHRVRVDIEITPFQQRPYLEVTLTDSQGEEVASASIVEPMSWKLEFTLHLRGEPRGPYTLQANLFYPDGPQAEPQTFTFDIPHPG